MKKVIVSVAAFSSSYNQASGKMFAVNEVLTNLKSLKPSFNGCTTGTLVHDIILFLKKLNRLQSFCGTKSLGEKAWKKLPSCLHFTYVTDRWLKQNT